MIYFVEFENLIFFRVVVARKLSAIRQWRKQRCCFRNKEAQDVQSTPPHKIENLIVDLS